MQRYYQLHYHMKKCGVRTVIEDLFSQVGNNHVKNGNLIYCDKFASYENDNIGIFNIDEIGYTDYIPKSKNEWYELSNVIVNKLNKVIPKLQTNAILTLLHCHNVTLFKNSVLTTAIQLFCNERSDVTCIIQIHDFAEDNRKDRMTITEKIKNLQGVVYPTNSNIKYITINQRDCDILKQAGCEAAVLSNPISMINDIDKYMDKDNDKSKTHQLKMDIQHYAKQNGYTFSMNKKILLYPVKILQRKNILESILILNNLNSIGNNVNFNRDDENKRKIKTNTKRNTWQLLISLDSTQTNDYCQQIKNYAKNIANNIVIGFGNELIDNIKYTKVDLFTIADLIISTSIQEGFGFTYLEAWLCNKKIIGRRIDWLFKEFENNAINLNHFYPELIVDNKKDFKDYSLNEQFKLLNYKIDATIMNQIVNVDDNIVINNKKQIIKHFSIEQIFKRLIDISKSNVNRSTNDNINQNIIQQYFQNQMDKQMQIKNHDQQKKIVKDIPHFLHLDSVDLAVVLVICIIVVYYLFYTLYSI